MDNQVSDAMNSSGITSPLVQATESSTTDPSDSPSSDPPKAQPTSLVPPVLTQTTSQKLQELQDAALKFFANASNETLGACAVGLCASTYWVLGRLGLVLIGAVGGVVLHATWENNQHHGEDQEARADSAKRRREQGLEIAKRALEWRSKNVSDDDTKSDKVEASLLTQDLDYSGFQQSTKQALTEFTDAVIRDYVNWWYAPVLPSELSFPTSCRQILTGFVLSFSNHISRRRTEDPFLDFIANSTSMIIVFLNELESALKASPNQEVEAAIRTYLEYETESSLANVLNDKQQEVKLRLVAEDILQTFLDSKTYNCGPAQVFLREVLTTLILKSTIATCSKAEWINGWIVYLLEEGEPEIMNAIDAGVETLGDKMATSRASEVGTTEVKRHQRRVSRAEEAMQDAMREAQRLNEMIAEDEARRKRGESIIETESTLSASTTDAGIVTPGSSDSERNRLGTESYEQSMIFDAEGNNIPSGTSSPARIASPNRQQQRQFTSFDQLTPAAMPTALRHESVPPPPTEAMSAAPLTLQNANITLLDMGTGNDKITMKTKPNDEFLVQIEPASARFSGWMVTRKYPDFEPLHETLRRIANVSGVYEFNTQHTSIPAWKGQTRASLIDHLETYLKQALKHERLAESEAMKKFLDKDTGLDRAPAGNKNVLLQGASALDNVGKGFINVLGQGGKGIAGGGKAVIGGVQGVFGAVGSTISGPRKNTSPTRVSTSDLSLTTTDSTPTLGSGRPSLDFVSGTDSQDESTPPPLPTRPSRSSLDQTATPSRTASFQAEEVLNLPPTPSEITEEFEPTPRYSVSSHKSTPSASSRPSIPSHKSTPSINSKSSRPATPTRFATSTPLSKTQVAMLAQPTKPASVSRSKPAMPLTDEETRMTVNLIFAIITSTYSLSSAWTFRLSLLSAAKTYLLRPNNPQLESIRTLLQESLIDNNTSDSAIANHVRKLRENTLPTEEELAKWPKESSAEEKEKLRIKARKLLVERGMPQALTSVMGQAASGEALGKVFDCLQIEKVARGLIFAVMLQGIRAVMQ